MAPRGWLSGSAGGDQRRRAGVVDAARGFDPAFTLATFHPREVLAIDPDAETLAAVWDSLTVERLYCAGGAGIVEIEAPAGWTRRDAGLQRYCYEKA